MHKILTHMLYDSTEAEFGVCCPLCVKSDSLGSHSLAESSKGRRPILTLESMALDTCTCLENVSPVYSEKGRLRIQ